MSPQLRISEQAHRFINKTLMWRVPEAGGLLLGPIDSNDITKFHFDETASCTGASYTPDHVTLNRLMKEAWLPNGLDMKGFIHSHPGCCDRLTAGDMTYIRRLLNSNGDMDVFAAPLVVPALFRLCPYVVLRENTRAAVAAELVIF